MEIEVNEGIDPYQIKQLIQELDVEKILGRLKGSCIQLCAVNQSQFFQKLEDLCKELTKLSENPLAEIIVPLIKADQVKLVFNWSNGGIQFDMEPIDRSGWVAFLYSKDLNLENLATFYQALNMQIVSQLNVLKVNFTNVLQMQLNGLIQHFVNRSRTQCLLICEIFQKDLEQIDAKCTSEECRKILKMMAIYDTQQKMKTLFPLEKLSREFDIDAQFQQNIKNQLQSFFKQVFSISDRNIQVNYQQVESEKNPVITVNWFQDYVSEYIKHKKIIQSFDGTTLATQFDFIKDKLIKINKPEFKVKGIDEIGKTDKNLFGLLNSASSDYICYQKSKTQFILKTQVIYYNCFYQRHELYLSINIMVPPSRIDRTKFSFVYMLVPWKLINFFEERIRNQLFICMLGCSKQSLQNYSLDTNALDQYCKELQGQRIVANLQVYQQQYVDQIAPGSRQLISQNEISEEVDHINNLPVQVQSQQGQHPQQYNMLHQNGNNKQKQEKQEKEAKQREKLKSTMRYMDFPEYDLKVNEQLLQKLVLSQRFYNKISEKVKVNTDQLRGLIQFETNSSQDQIGYQNWNIYNRQKEITITSNLNQYFNVGSLIVEWKSLKLNQIFLPIDGQSYEWKQKVKDLYDGKLEEVTCEISLQLKPTTLEKILLCFFLFQKKDQSNLSPEFLKSTLLRILSGDLELFSVLTQQINQ